jgi:hypothetical protein
LLSALARPAQATNYYVDEGVGNNSYDGLSDVVSGGDGPKFNVSAAISVATGGSIIQVDSGDYAESVWDSGANNLTLDPQNDVNICGADLCDADTVGDGIPDWWRLEYFSTPTTTNAASCASCDADGSGYSNLQDYLAGIDPTNFPPNNLPAAACFTNQYGIYGASFISIAPWTSQGIFYQGDPVTISNSLGTTIEVYDFHSNRITNAAPPVTLTDLPMGHYFVQVDGNATTAGFGDRSQFSVWPTGYTNYLHSDIGELPTATFAESNRFTRIAPGFSRIQLTWGAVDITGSNSTGVGDYLIQTNGTVADTNTYCFGTFDQFIFGGGPCGGYFGAATNFGQGYFGNGTNCTTMLNPPVPLKVINLIMAHTTNCCWTMPAGELTNSLQNWVSDVAVTYSNLAIRYGTNCVYEILNEPSSQLAFSEDPYSNIVAFGGYPASLAVSAAVQAIQFVCTNCQTWAPANQGLANWTLGILTNSFEIPGYTNVSAISFHGEDAYFCPIDAVLTNPPFGGGTPNIWLPTDSNDVVVANIFHKPFYTTEQYPNSPDVLGKTSYWWTVASGTNAPDSSWTWYTMAMRWWKALIEFKGTGVVGNQHFLGLSDAGTNVLNDGTYYGWDASGLNGDSLGCGPNPSVDGLAMLSWWLPTNATLITTWLSGTQLVVNNIHTLAYNGTPGLHFWTWKFADGTTNTFVWADEQITVSTNFGVGLTDIFSNQWNGPIGIEPVIAWGWHGP